VVVRLGLGFASATELKAKTNAVVVKAFISPASCVYAIGNCGERALVPSLMAASGHWAIQSKFRRRSNYPDDVEN
jgi:hypothetical protein